MFFFCQIAFFKIWVEIIMIYNNSNLVPGPVPVSDTRCTRPTCSLYLGLAGGRGVTALVALRVCVGGRGVCAQVSLRR